MKILANENFPRAAVDALVQNHHDVVWILTDSPGMSDRDVLAKAKAESRLIVTFDKDFGELAFRSALPAACGIILFRIDMKSPTYVAEVAVAALASRDDWAGHFSGRTESHSDDHSATLD